MFRVVLGILVLCGAVAGIPALRDRVAPLLKPVMARIEPHTRAISDPYRRVRAATQERDIIRVLSQEHAEGKLLPVMGEFRTWQKYNNVRVDPWQRPFFLILRHDSVYVGSNGPDGRRGTVDDVLTGTPWR